jgi:hypothetical protein
MKDFASWVSDMANSIEDNSTFLRETCVECAERKKQEKTNPPKVEWNDSQIRMKMADLLIGEVRTLKDVDMWLRVYCSSFDISEDKVNENFILRIQIQNQMTSFTAAGLKVFRENIEKGFI